MRIRTIKPDAFKSDSLSEVPRGTRWTFAGLWTYADDAGRARDDARLVKAELYPIDDATTREDVDNDLALLAGVGAICRYEVAGKRYFHIPGWHHQKINRPTSSRLPECPIHECSTTADTSTAEDSTQALKATSEPSPAAHAVLTEDSPPERKGKEKEQGTGNTSASAAAERDFAAWWATYPRKRDKGHAAQAYRRARRKASAEQLLTALQRQLPHLQRAEEQFVPYPATWLNGERWNDEPPRPSPASVDWMNP